tara:strand:+ start:284 stop:541 length:258 start_codon:yes stop_codon:yes gene_type:complete
MGKVTFHYENGITIEWNGLATFNVFNDGHNTDCFTHYGTTENKNGYSYISTTKAHEIADEHYEELYTEWQQELAMDNADIMESPQ